jgi:hypothetical protein
MNLLQARETMSDGRKHDETPTIGTPVAESSTRREFLGKTAAAAVVATGVPAMLAACGDASAPLMASTSDAGAPPRLEHKKGEKPWWTVHHKLLATIGSATNVTVPSLEEVDGRYLQRIITRDDRTGTGLATVLRGDYSWPDGALTVSVEDGRGKKWPARKVGSQEDVVYAMKDALATNTLSDGVLRESLDPGRPVVAIIKPSVVQFWDSAQSDYYGNFLQVASESFSDLFNAVIGGVKITSTTRDLKHS